MYDVGLQRARLTNVAGLAVVASGWRLDAQPGRHEPRLKIFAENDPTTAPRHVVDDDRLLNYHKLMREARRSQQTPLDRIAQVAKWKVMQRAAVARSKDKLGKR